MSETVMIDERFHGPAGSANGGYACAMAARSVDGPAEVTLRVPPPLGRELTILQQDDRVALLDGDVLVAEARPTTVDVEVPDPPSFAEAERAAVRYPWRDTHPYPTCFVCGPQRKAGDGLCIFPGPVEGRSRDGRKLNTASALFTAVGELSAVARAVWIEVRAAD